MAFTVDIRGNASHLEKTLKSAKGSIASLGSAATAGVGALTALGAAGAAGIAAFVVSSSKAASNIESLTMQFETLLGSADAAGKRMQEIVEFAASTPFEVAELAAASKQLQTVGGNMLGIGEGLRMVGDAAAMTGKPLEEIALHIGRVFGAMVSGTSAGESVGRLQELGLITGDVKREFEALAEAAKKAGGSQGKDLEKLKKSADKANESIPKLEQQLGILFMRRAQMMQQEKVSQTSARSLALQIEEQQKKINDAKKAVVSYADAMKKAGSGQKDANPHILDANSALQKLKSVLSQTDGAMQRLSTTTEGMRSNLADNISKLQVAFGSGFNEGFKDALTAANNFLPQLEGRFKEAGQIVGVAITKSVEGNSQQLALIGSYIGEVIMSGMSAAILIGLDQTVGIMKQVKWAVGSNLDFIKSKITGEEFKGTPLPEGPSIAPRIQSALNQVSQSQTLSEIRKNNARAQDIIDINEFLKSTKEGTKQGVKDGMKEVWHSLDTGAKFQN